MPCKPEERLNRHYFIVVLIATIGASAALAANADSANDRVFR
jgi:hypothetical protein